MDANQANQMVMIYGNKLPAAYLPTVKEQLLTMDFNTANLLFSQMKDPTTAIVISILLGGYGIDRIYVGDVGLGILKLFTCGGLCVWWLVDLFLIMDRTREKNMKKLFGNVVID